MTKKELEVWLKQIKEVQKMLGVRVFMYSDKEGGIFAEALREFIKKRVQK